MANPSRIYKEMAAYVLGVIAHPLRGIITAIPKDFQTSAAPMVSVRVTPSGASYARDYENVPWALTVDASQSRKPPQPGDYVTLVFKGASSEFPVVVAYYPGPNTAATNAGAQADRAAIPTGAITSAAKPGGSVGGNATAPSSYADLYANYGDPALPSFGAQYLTPLNVETSSSPVSVQCHKSIMLPLQDALNRAAQAGLIHSCAGCYNFRNVRGGSKLSLHSWGLAIDLNAGDYPLGSTRQQDPQLISIMSSVNMLCGQYYRGRTDPMHFDFCQKLF